jgi:hypothetical protein
MIKNMIFHKFFYYWFLILCAAMIILTAIYLGNKEYFEAIVIGVGAILQWWFAGVAFQVINNFKVIKDN